MEQISTPGPNPQQQEAIHTTEGPLLIIAGPGSGKTFTLVERIYHLISQNGISPERLFVSTFTEKAAAELVTRISSRLDADNISVNLNEMYIGTFHSICLRFLEENRDFTRLKRSFTLLDQFDQRYFIYQRLFEYQGIEGNEHILGNPKSSWWGKARNLMTWVNKVSEEALDPEVLLNAAEPEVQALGRCYQQYQEHLEEENCLDFSTIQVEALRLLENHPEILDKIRDKIQYLMVDEVPRHQHDPRTDPIPNLRNQISTSVSLVMMIKDFTDFEGQRYGISWSFHRIFQRVPASKSDSLRIIDPTQILLSFITDGWKN